MAEHDRRPDRPVVVRGMKIAVANAGRFDFDEHLSGSRRQELDLLDGEGLPALPENRRAGDHRGMPFAV
jgi:hypothetical protein